MDRGKLVLGVQVCLLLIAAMGQPALAGDCQGDRGPLLLVVGNYDESFEASFFLAEQLGKRHRWAARRCHLSFAIKATDASGKSSEVVTSGLVELGTGESFVFDLPLETFATEGTVQAFLELQQLDGAGGCRPNIAVRMKETSTGRTVPPIVKSVIYNILAPIIIEDKAIICWEASVIAAMTAGPTLPWMYAVLKWCGVTN